MAALIYLVFGGDGGFLKVFLRVQGFWEKVLTIHSPPVLFSFF